MPAAMSAMSQILMPYCTAISTAVTVGCGLYYIHTQRKKSALESRLDEIMRLLTSHGYVHVRDDDNLRSKLTTFLTDGNNKMQIMTDFDMTLTAYRVNGQMGDTSYTVVEHSDEFPKETLDKLRALRSHYYPIEMSTSIPKSEKIPLMEQWFRESTQLLIDVGISRSRMKEMVRTSNIGLRSGAVEFFELMDSHHIPVLILSAGVGEVVTAAMKQHCPVACRQKIISNFWKYNNQGVPVSLKNAPIHTFNKRDVTIHDPEYFETNKNRHNLFLMGDTLGDPHMADGVTFRKETLGIGFLNHDVSEALPAYKMAYDIVLVDDPGMDVVVKLTNLLTKPL